MIVWTTVQVLLGFVALGWAISFLREEIRTGFDLEFGTDVVAGVFASLGLIGSPIWIAANMYPEDHWEWFGIMFAVLAGMSVYISVAASLIVYGILYGLFYTVTYPMPFAKAKRERELKRLQYEDWD